MYNITDVDGADKPFHVFKPFPFIRAFSISIQWVSAHFLFFMSFGQQLSTNQKTSRRPLSDFKTRAERESFESDKGRTSNLLMCLLIGEVIFKVNLLKSEKIKVEVYVNQRKSLADLKPLLRL